jgi:sortase A
VDVFVERSLHWLEGTLLAIGVACLGWYGYSAIEARSFQHEQTVAFERAEETRKRETAVAGAPVPVPAPSAPTTASKSEEADRNLIGILEIPRLGLSTPVMRGDDDATLDVAVGHLPDTPDPWDVGNSAIAGHRDGLFRPLKNIRVGDQIHVRTTRGDLTYRVQTIRIVTPKDLSVLDPSSSSVLTLITCYPFNFVGNAPKRFIVRAERVDAPTARVASTEPADRRP